MPFDLEDRRTDALGEAGGNPFSGLIESWRSMNRGQLGWQLATQDWFRRNPNAAEALSRILTESPMAIGPRRGRGFGVRTPQPEFTGTSPPSGEPPFNYVPSREAPPDYNYPGYRQQTGIVRHDGRTVPVQGGSPIRNPFDFVPTNRVPPADRPTPIIGDYVPGIPPFVRRPIDAEFIPPARGAPDVEFLGTRDRPPTNVIPFRRPANDNTPGQGTPLDTSRSHVGQLSALTHEQMQVYLAARDAGMTPLIALRIAQGNPIM